MSSFDRVRVPQDPAIVEDPSFGSGVPLRRLVALILMGDAALPAADGELDVRLANPSLVTWEFFGAALAGVFSALVAVAGLVFFALGLAGTPTSAILASASTELTVVFAATAAAIAGGLTWRLRVVLGRLRSRGERDP